MNCQAIGFVNSAVTVLFTKPSASQFPAVPWLRLGQFLKICEAMNKGTVSDVIPSSRIFYCSAGNDQQLAGQCVKLPASWFPAIPWLCLGQFLKISWAVHGAGSKWDCQLERCLGHCNRRWDAGHESLMDFPAFIRELMPSGNEVCFSTCLSFIRGAGQLPWRGLLWR